MIYGSHKADCCVCRSRTRANGATQTFRRPSLATSFSQRDGSQANSNPTPASGSIYIPPHVNANYQSSYNRNGSSSESRYSKDQLLDLFRAQEKSGVSNVNLSDLYVDGWNPNYTNGTTNGGWGKRDDHKDATGPEICWDHEGSVHPLALAEMTEEEKEVAHYFHFALGKALLMKCLGIRFICQFATEAFNPKCEQGWYTE